MTKSMSQAVTFGSQSQTEAISAARSVRVAPVAPLLPILLAVAAGIVADRYLEPSGRAPETLAWGLIGLVSLGLAFVTPTRRRLGLLLFLVACVAIGGGWHHHRRFDLAPDDLARSISETPQPVWIRGVVREYLGLRGARPTAAGDGQGGSSGGPERASTRFVVEITSVRDGDSWKPERGLVLMIVNGDRSDVRAGRAIDVAGSVARIPPPLNPGEFDYRDHLRGDGIWLRLTVKDPSSLRRGNPRDDRLILRALGALRDWSRDRLVGSLNPDIAPLASALLLGQREEVDEQVNEAFVRTGTTHLLAISGLHLQALAISIGLCLALAGLSPSTSAAGVAVTVAGYAVLVGLSPSVVRSAAMTLTISLAIVFYRQSRALNNLALAGLVTLALNPCDLFDIGCQLSFLAIVALIWLMPEARRFLESGHRAIRDRLEGPPTALDELERLYAPAWLRWSRRLGLWLLKGVLTSLVVWFAALPLVVYRFHLISPISIPLNVPLILSTSVALMTGGVGLVLAGIWSPLAIPFGLLTTWLLQFTTWAVEWGARPSWGHWFAASPPWWWVCGFYAILGLALIAPVIQSDRQAETSRTWYAWRRLIWLLVILWLVPGWPMAMVSDRPAQVEADLLAVGHGLATVVQTPSGAAYLYDCGRMGDPSVGRRVIAPALWERGIAHLNSVILSHADDDHYNGLPDLFDRFGIGEVCIPPGFGGPANPAAVQLIESIRDRGIPIRTIASPDSWTVGRAAFRLWHPPAGWDRPDATDNARSIVLEVESSGRRLVLTGDLEQLGLVELVARPIDRTPIDVILSPHHGGKTANPEWLYGWAKPRAVLVSQRAPIPGSTDLLAKMERDGTPIYRTWRDGAVRLTWRPAGITVEPRLIGPGDVEESPSSSLIAEAMSLQRITIISYGDMKLISWVVGASGFVVGLLLFGRSAVIELTAWTLLVPPRPRERPADPTSPVPPPLDGTPLRVVAADGSRLAGMWFPTTARAAPRGTVLLLHGFGESAEGLAAGRVAVLNREGWDVLVPDSRGYGESAGPYATFGAHEAGDVDLWIGAIPGREELALNPSLNPGPVIVWGRSMGGAIAARAAGQSPTISALILESPMLDLHAALALILRRRRLPFASTLANMVLRRANRLAGATLDRPNLHEVASKVDCPVLIVQGGEDSLAPIGTIRDLARRFPQPAEVIEIPGAGHTDAMDMGGEDAWRRIMAFMNAQK